MISFHFTKIHSFTAFCFVLFCLISCDSAQNNTKNETFKSSLISELLEDFSTSNKCFCSSSKSTSCIDDRNKFLDRVYKSFKGGSTDFGFNARNLIDSLPKETFDKIWLLQEGQYTKQRKKLSEKRVFEKRNVINFNPKGEFMNFLQTYVKSDEGRFLESYLQLFDDMKVLSPSMIANIMQHYEGNYPENNTQSIIFLINLLTIEYNHNLDDMAR